MVVNVPNYFSLPIIVQLADVTARLGTLSQVYILSCKVNHYINCSEQYSPHQGLRLRLFRLILYLTHTFIIQKLYEDDTASTGIQSDNTWVLSVYLLLSIHPVMNLWFLYLFMYYQCSYLLHTFCCFAIRPLLSPPPSSDSPVIVWHMHEQKHYIAFHDPINHWPKWYIWIFK